MCLPSFSSEGDSMRFRYNVWALLGIMLALILAGCATKERMANSTMRIGVSPTGTEMLVSATQQFSAQASNAGNAVSTSVRWSVDGGAANGTITQTGLYTAPSTITHPLTVTIKAEQDGVTGTAVIRVSTRNDAEKEFTKKRFYFYQDEYPTTYLDTKSTTTIQYIKYDTANPPDSLGGVMFVPQGSGITLGASTDYAYEGKESLKITGTGAGWFVIQFGTLATVRSYSLIQTGSTGPGFWLKDGTFYFRLKPSSQLASGQLKVKLGWTGGGDTGEIAVDWSSLTPTNGWYLIALPFTSCGTLNDHLDTFQSIIFVVPNNATDPTYIDAIYFEK